MVAYPPLSPSARSLLLQSGDRGALELNVILRKPPTTTGKHPRMDLQSCIFSFDIWSEDLRVVME